MSRICCCAWWGLSAPLRGPSPPPCGRTARHSAGLSRCRCSKGLTSRSRQKGTWQTSLWLGSTPRKPLKFKWENSSNIWGLLEAGQNEDNKWGRLLRSATVCPSYCQNGGWGAPQIYHLLCAMKEVSAGCKESEWGNAAGPGQRPPHTWMLMISLPLTHFNFNCFYNLCSINPGVSDSGFLDRPLPYRQAFFERVYYLHSFLHANQPANNQSKRAEHQKLLSEISANSHLLGRAAPELSHRGAWDPVVTLCLPQEPAPINACASCHTGKCCLCPKGSMRHRNVLWEVQNIQSCNTTISSDSQSRGPLMPIVFQTKDRTWDKIEVCAPSTIRSKMLIIPVVLLLLFFFLKLLLTMYNQSRNKVISMTSPFLDALMKIILPPDFEIPKLIQEASATLGEPSRWGGVSIRSILCTSQWPKGNKWNVSKIALILLITLKVTDQELPKHACNSICFWSGIWLHHFFQLHQVYHKDLELLGVRPPKARVIAKQKFLMK